jgi:hypothetical protein
LLTSELTYCISFSTEKTEHGGDELVAYLSFIPSSIHNMLIRTQKQIIQHSPKPRSDPSLKTPKDLTLAVVKKHLYDFTKNRPLHMTFPASR